MALAPIDPKHIHLVTIRHANFGIALDAHGPLDAPDAPHVQVWPEAVKDPKDVVALVQEHQAGPCSAAGGAVDPRPDHAVIVAEQTANGAGQGAVEEDWGALFGEGGEVSGAARCVGAHEGGETVVANEALNGNLAPCWNCGQERGEYGIYLQMGHCSRRFLLLSCLYTRSSR